MTTSPERKWILIIDRQDYWRELSVRAFREIGHSIRALDNYEYPPRDGHFRDEVPDLVILGCASIGPEEQELIGHILEHKHHLLVLCTSLPWRVMRALFIAGADDVADKPYDPARLINIVEPMLESTLPSDSYRAAKQDSVP
jgi:DNA-binding NtrC family response regulator